MQWNFAEEPKYDSGIKMRKRCKSHKFIRMTRLSYDIKNLKHGRPLIDSKKREKKARNDLCFSVCDIKKKKKTAELVASQFKLKVTRYE